MASGIFTALAEGRPNPPAGTLIAVPALFAPDYLIEVEVIAAVQRRGRREASRFEGQS